MMSLEYRGKRMLFTLMILIALMLTACGQDESSVGASENVEGTNKEKISLKLVTAFAKNSIDNEYAEYFVKNVEEMSDGLIEVKLMGGQEVIPPFELGQGISTGVADIGFLPGGYYGTLIPEVDALMYSDYTFEEEMSNGAYDYINKIHKDKGNLHLLYVSRKGSNYALYTKDHLNGIEDFEGYQMRVPPHLIPFAKEVGIELITTQIADVYTALERGMVDGIGFVDKGITEYGWEEFLKYNVTPALYKADLELIVNHDTWSKVPEEAQEILFAAAKKADEQKEKNYNEYKKVEQEKFDELGIKELNLGDELKEVARDAGWKSMQSKSPEHHQKLEELFRKE